MTDSLPCKMRGIVECVVGMVSDSCPKATSISSNDRVPQRVERQGNESRSGLGTCFLTNVQEHMGAVRELEASKVQLEASLVSSKYPSFDQALTDYGRFSVRGPSKSFDRLMQASISEWKTCSRSKSLHKKP